MMSTVLSYMQSPKNEENSSIYMVIQDHHIKSHSIDYLRSVPERLSHNQETHSLEGLLQLKTILHN